MSSASRFSSTMWRHRRATLRPLVSAARNVRSAPSQIQNARSASTAFRMPAMSPTMTEGGIANWKKEEGEKFEAGDVLLEIETDKATIDVEAQDEGVMGKIISPSGSQKVPVGQIIAILAEEGDDLSAIEVPANLAPEGSAQSAETEQPVAEKSEKAAPEKQESSSSSSSSSGVKVAQDVSSSDIKHHQAITHPKPLFPSVSRLLIESGLSSDEISKLKGTGRNGMLTKGDVLLALGKIKDAKGTASKLQVTTYGVAGGKSSESVSTTPPSSGSAAPAKPLNAADIRRLVLDGLDKASRPQTLVAAGSVAASQDFDFDSILEPYTTLVTETQQPGVELPSVDLLVEEKVTGHETASHHAAKDEWDGLF